VRIISSTRIRYCAQVQHYNRVLLPEGATAAAVTSSEVSDSGAYSTCWAEGSLGSAVRLLTYIGRNVHSMICGQNRWIQHISSQRQLPRGQHTCKINTLIDGNMRREACRLPPLLTPQNKNEGSYAYLDDTVGRAHQQAGILHRIGVHLRNQPYAAEARHGGRRGRDGKGLDHPVHTQVEHAHLQVRRVLNDAQRVTNTLLEVGTVTEATLTYSICSGNRYITHWVPRAATSGYVLLHRCSKSQ
jgi:hypothetical protein